MRLTITHLNYITPFVGSFVYVAIQYNLRKNLKFLDSTNIKAKNISTSFHIRIFKFFIQEMSDHLSVIWWAAIVSPFLYCFSLEIKFMYFSFYTLETSLRKKDFFLKTVLFYSPSFNGVI